MVLAWDRNSVLTQANYILNVLQIFGGVVQEKESNMGFCRRWAFRTLGMTVLSGTEALALVPLSTVIPRDGNANPQQNPILDSYIPLNCIYKDMDLLTFLFVLEAVSLLLKAVPFESGRNLLRNVFL